MGEWFLMSTLSLSHTHRQWSKMLDHISLQFFFSPALAFYVKSKNSLFSLRLLVSLFSF